MKNLLIQIFSGIDGKTIDPARLVGYVSALAVVATFVFNSIWVVVHSGVFDPAAYGLGGSAVLAGIMAVGAGVGFKAHTEPTS